MVVILLPRQFFPYLFIGGFVNNESLDKSEVEYLYNSSMSYTLYSVENGNFRPISSNKNEAF